MCERESAGRSYSHYSMQILISGASGLIGSAIQSALAGSVYSSAALVRRPARAGEVQWDPGQPLDPQVLGNFDAIVHLAGKPISGRWSEKFKREVRESRVLGTRTLATAAAASFRRTGFPRIMVTASAIGYYGNRGDEELTEDSSPGSGFLAEVCDQWEAAAHAAAEAGVRVVNLRIGMVLARHGGALKAMLPAFRLALGGPIGDGRQYISWLALDDLADIFLFALTNNSLQGPVNAVSPQPVRNTEFVRVLGKILNRPAILPLPAFVVRTVFGEMGEVLLLGSARVRPANLLSAGYSFRHSDLGEALRAVLNQS